MTAEDRQFDAKSIQIQNAVSEWGYRDSSEEGVKFSASIPCQFRFTGEPTQDVFRFHEALEKREFSASDTHPGGHLSADKVQYDGEVISDEYHRIKLRITSRAIRIYPRERVPSAEMLARLVNAVCIGFDSGVVHSPIDRE